MLMKVRLFLSGFFFSFSTYLLFILPVDIFLELAALFLPFRFRIRVGPEFLGVFGVFEITIDRYFLRNDYAS